MADWRDLELLDLTNSILTGYFHAVALLYKKTGEPVEFQDIVDLMGSSKQATCQNLRRLTGLGLVRKPVRGKYVPSLIARVPDAQGALVGRGK